jgi:hypothetical protein
VGREGAGWHNVVQFGFFCEKSYNYPIKRPRAAAFSGKGN